LIKEEFHIRKRMVEVEMDLRQEEVEIRRPDKEHGTGGALWELPGQAPSAWED